MAAFYATKRLRSRLSGESDSPLKLAQQRGVRAASRTPRRSTSTISVKHIPTKTPVERHELLSNTKHYRSGIGAIVNTVPRFRLPRAHSPGAEHHAARPALQSSRRSRGVARHDFAPTPFNGARYSPPRSASLRRRSSPSAARRALAYHSPDAVVPPRRLRRRLGAPARGGQRPSTRAAPRRAHVGGNWCALIRRGGGSGELRACGAESRHVQRL